MDATSQVWDPQSRIGSGNTRAGRKDSGGFALTDLLVLVVHLGLGLVRITRRCGASRLQQQMTHKLTSHTDEFPGTAGQRDYVSTVESNIQYLLVVVGVHLLGVLSLELLGLRDVGSLLLHFRNRKTSGCSISVLVSDTNIYCIRALKQVNMQVHQQNSSMDEQISISN